MNRIKMLREEKGMTQQELADKIGGAKSTIAMYEKGDRKPSLEVIVKLSQIFDCTIDYLLGRSNYRNEDDFFGTHLEETKQFIEFDLPKEFSEDVIDDFIKRVEKEPIEKFEQELRTFLTQYPENLKSKVENYIRFMYSYSKNLGIQEQTELTIKKALRKLDKNESEFQFAYHKEAEGLTDEEIADALRFYKEMKKRVGGNNGDK